MPRRNKRKKNKYEKLRYLTRRDVRAFNELKSFRVDSGAFIANDHRCREAHAGYGSGAENRPERHGNCKDIAPKRGEIWYVDLGEFDNTSVQRGMRPAVIVSSDMVNGKSGVVTVVPLTSKMKKTWYPCHIMIDNDDLETAAPAAGGSSEASAADAVGAKGTDGRGESAAQKPRKDIVPSQVLVEQLQTVDKHYLSRKVGTVNHLKMQEVEEAMRESLTL